MERDIQDFIYYMTHSKSLSKEQQAKRNKLLTRDLSAAKEEKKSSEPNKETKKLSNARICEIHEPRKVFEFLHKFTANNTALKYTTHYWDKNVVEGKYEYDDFNVFKSAYRDILEKGDPNLSSIYNLCEHLWQTIKNFLMLDEPGKYTWSEHSLKLGYNKYVGQWMNDNPGLQPASMPISAFPEDIQPKGLINGKVLSYFGDIIDIFKRCIEFRDNDLYISIIRTFRSADHNIDKQCLESVKGRAIYTDTEQIKEALKIIAGNIFQRPMYPNLKISCDTSVDGKNKVLNLRILQVGSFSNRDISHAKLKASSNEGDFYRIKVKLRNLCDFAVESKFRIGDDIRHCRINYLSSNEKIEDIEYLDNEGCEGFTYILTFYVV